jgi:ketosteroid isomerase-like protein
MPFVDKDKKNIRASSVPGYKEEMDDILRRMNPEMKRPKPGPDAMAAAMEAVQRLAADADVEDAVDDMHRIGSDPGTCSVCGYRNREQIKFCGMCGVAMSSGEGPTGERQESQSLMKASSFPAEIGAVPPRPVGNETHHYHHHYHHHYFQGGQEGTFPRGGLDPMREEKLRTPNAALRGEMSRAEAAVRRVTQEWVLACNTKHLDDVLELYISDAIVMRSNCPPLRGAAALREFFFGALDSGLGEAEMEAIRVEIVGDLAYEAGRFKALVPSAAGKRREERGKYLWVCQRQAGGEWKVAADCWSSDLTLTNLESDVPLGGGVKTSHSRKGS